MIVYWTSREKGTGRQIIHRYIGPVEIEAHTPFRSGWVHMLDSGQQTWISTVLDDSTEPPTVLVHECPLHNLSDWGAEGLPEFVIYHGNIVRTRDYQVVVRGPDGAENLNPKIA